MQQSRSTRLATALALLALVVGATACGGSDDSGASQAADGGASAEGGDYKFYSVVHGTGGNPFWAVYYKGLRDAADRYGVEVKELAPQEGSSAQKQADLVDSAIAAKPDGLIVSIPDQNALDGSLRRAVDEGIPVIAVNAFDTRSASERIPYLFYVGEDSVLAGRVLAERVLAERKPQRAVCEVPLVGHVAIEGRCKGFVEEMRANGVEAEKLVVDGDNPTLVAERIRAYLSSNSDTDAIMSQGPVGSAAPDGTLQVLEQQGLTDKVTLVTTDLSPQTVQAINDGDLLATMDQQQYLQGYLPVEFLKLNLDHGFVPASDITTGPFVVDKANVDKVAEGTEEKVR